MRLDAITRLRLSFAALALVLLGPLLWLFFSVERRVEAQRRLRHQVVAERIFDEVERELTLLLDKESTRPSLAYDAGTNPDEWASYVVGYFKIDAGQPALLSEDRLDADRRQRMRWALARIDTGQPTAPHASDTETTTPRLPQAAPASDHQPALASDAAVTRPKARSPSDVLRSLNRAAESRDQTTQKQSRQGMAVEAY